MLHASLGRMNAYDIQYSVGFLRCLSLYSRQCEGLETWDKREVQFPRFFILWAYEYTILLMGWIGELKDINCNIMGNLTKKQIVESLIEGVIFFFAFVMFLFLLGEKDGYYKYHLNFDVGGIEGLCFFSFVFSVILVNVVLRRIRKQESNVSLISFIYSVITTFMVYALVDEGSGDDYLDYSSFPLLFLVMIASWVIIRYIQTQKQNL